MAENGGYKNKMMLKESHLEIQIARYKDAN